MPPTAPTPTFEIAPGKTNRDWLALSPKLAKADAATWCKVLREYYRARLDSRYLDAIAAIRKPRASKGEGFAVVAIQCSLIEFLESCLRGINYKFKKPKRPYEYKGSSQVFVSFLTKRHPFKPRFTKALAEEFYEAVRCGILHEARTKGAWRIWTSSGVGTIIDPARHIVYRDDFQEALERFIDAYCMQVAQNPKLQQAFVRKYDALAGV